MSGAIWTRSSTTWTRTSSGSRQEADENFEVFEPDFREVRDLGDRIDHGKLVRWEDFRDRERALEAAGLSE